MENDSQFAIRNSQGLCDAFERAFDLQLFVPRLRCFDFVLVTRHGAEDEYHDVSSIQAI